PPTTRGRARPRARRDGAEPYAGPSGQARLKGDLGAGERLADRAVGLGLLRGALEVLRRDARHSGADRQVDPGDALARLERDVRPGVDLLRGSAGPREAVRERHREARAVRGGDELLGARLAIGLLGPRRPVHRELSDLGRI